MVNQELGKRIPLISITNSHRTESTNFSRNKINLNEREKTSSDENSFNNNENKHLEANQVLINLEDSSSSSCCLNNSGLINITSSTINSSISNNSNNSNKTQKSKKKVQFLSNEALDKLESANKKYYNNNNNNNNNDNNNNNNNNNKLKLHLNSLPVKNYTNYHYMNNKYNKPINQHHTNNCYPKSKSINFVSSSSSASTNKPNLTYSNTMPSISSVLTNQYSRLKTNHSSYAICESDNPFRPEGCLAKEADQFVKDLNTKKEREVIDIIKNTSLNNSGSISVSELIQQPSDSELALTSNQPTRAEEKAVSKSDVVSLPEPRSPIKSSTEEEPLKSTENQITINQDSSKPKKKKVKSKCGCLIS